MLFSKLKYAVALSVCVIVAGCTGAAPPQPSAGTGGPPKDSRYAESYAAKQELRQKGAENVSEETLEKAITIGGAKGQKADKE